MVWVKMKQLENEKPIAVWLVKLDGRSVGAAFCLKVANGWETRHFAGSDYPELVGDMLFDSEQKSRAAALAYIDEFSAEIRVQYPDKRVEVKRLPILRFRPTEYQPG